MESVPRGVAESMALCRPRVCQLALRHFLPDCSFQILADIKRITREVSPGLSAWTSPLSGGNGRPQKSLRRSSQ